MIFQKLFLKLFCWIYNLHTLLFWKSTIYIQIQANAWKHFKLGALLSSGHQKVIIKVISFYFIHFFLACFIFILFQVHPLMGDTEAVLGIDGLKVWPKSNKTALLGLEWEPSIKQRNSKSIHAEKHMKEVLWIWVSFTLPKK